MPRLILALPAILALAACNQQTTADTAAQTGEVSLKNATIEEVAKQAQAAGPQHFTAGEWETNVEIIEMDLPGAPPQVRDQMMKAMQSSKTSAKTCMTKEQAEKPEASILTGKTNANCKYDHYTMADGKIDAKLSCTSPHGGNMTQTINGTYTPTSFAIASEMHAVGGSSEAGAMNMKAKTSGTRIGECKAGG
jgi:hypothetical protein